jgi:hypothetical protein
VAFLASGEDGVERLSHAAKSACRLLAYLFALQPSWLFHAVAKEQASDASLRAAKLVPVIAEAHRRPLAGIGSNGLQVNTALRVDTDPAALYDTDPWFRNVWVKGCVASGENAAFCRCAISEYTTRLQPYEFEIAHAVAHGARRLAELPEHVREVIQDVGQGCR